MTIELINPSALSHMILILRKKAWTLSCAESCTGGLLSATITQAAGVSDVYIGSVVSYANSVKENILGVKIETLKK